MAAQTALFELPLVAAAVALALEAAERPRQPGAVYFIFLALPLAAAAAMGALRYGMEAAAGSAPDAIVALHHALAQSVGAIGMWGLLFGTVSIVSRRTIPTSYALVAAPVSVYVLLYRGSQRAVHAPVFIGTVLTAIPAYWGNDDHHGQACARALLLCVVCFGVGAVARQGGAMAPSEMVDLPLSNTDILHLSLVAGALSLRRAIQDARLMPQLHAE